MLLAPALLAAILLPQAPDVTLPRSTAAIVLTAEGRGVQIYSCTTQNGGFHWTFQAPEAQLFDQTTGKQIGRHGAGPIWTLEDGSSIKGTVIGNRPGDTAADVSWLLLSTEATGSAQGALSRVRYVRRSNTHGGSAPPTGCDAQHQGNTIRVPYTATYAFYATPD